MTELQHIKTVTSAPSIVGKADINSSLRAQMLWTPAFAEAHGINENVWPLVPPGRINADMVER